MDDPVVCLLKGAEVGRSEAVLALRHLPLPIRKELLSDDHQIRRRAEGRFFEAVIYELLRKAGEESPHIRWIAAWGADATASGGSKDGIWYSRDGRIRICSFGVIVAEVDLLFADRDGRIFFAEAMITPQPPSAFYREVQQKKALLSALAGGGEVQFLSFLPVLPPAGYEPLYGREGQIMVRLDIIPLISEMTTVIVGPRKRRPLYHPKVVSGTSFFSAVPVSREQTLLSYIQRFFLK